MCLSHLKSVSNGLFEEEEAPIALNPVLIVTHLREEMSAFRNTEALNIWMQEWEVNFLQRSRVAWLRLMRHFVDLNSLVTAIQAWANAWSQESLPEEFGDLTPYYLIAADFVIDPDSLQRLFLFRQYLHVSLSKF